jgi:hypothetical protein
MMRVVLRRLKVGSARPATSATKTPHTELS